MELMQSPSSIESHAMQVDNPGSSIDIGLGGSWRSSKLPAAKTISTAHASRTQIANKKKEKERLEREPFIPLQSSPRRIASSKALKHGMWKSALPIPAYGIGITSSADVSSEAISKAPSLLLTAASSSYSSSSSRETPLSPLSNRRQVRKRRVQSLSPLPNTRSSDGCSQEEPLAQSTSPDDSTSLIDDAEQDQFNFKAVELDSTTSILARPAPTLPYDASYQPLSPNNLDQLGHILVPVSISGQSTAKTLGEVSKHGKGHATSNKKILPGQDLEEHIISQIPGQRTMPWGLQTTLQQRQLGGKRARTKMGSLKRTALRHVNRRGIKLTPTFKLDDDFTPEIDSPRLPLIEISEVDSTAGIPPSMDMNEEECKDQDMKEGQSIKERTPDLLPPVSDPKANAESKDGQVAQSASSPKKKAKGRRSQMLDLAPWPTSADDSMLSGESSSQEGANGTLDRPREVRKRLKLVGGYYNKLPRHRQDKEAEMEVKTDDAIAGTTAIDCAPASISRGISLTAEDVTAATLNDFAAMSSSPPPAAADTGSLSNSMKKAAMNIPLTSSLRRMTTAAPLHGSPSKLNHASGEAINADGGEAGNNEFCETCQGIGHFICCDGCPRSFHFACINPPLDIDELPTSIGDKSDTWYCNVCRAADVGKRREKGKQIGGLFASLIRYTDEENPTIFTLPSDVRNYFQGVSTASDGSYINTSMLRPIKVNKFGIVEEREPLRLKDKNGRPILCFHCGESAMPSELALSSPTRQRDRPARQAAKVANAAVFSQSSAGVVNFEEKGNNTTWRRIVSCDFCNLHWHLDCLDPPLASMPSLNRKWMCPNHIEHVFPSERIPKSVANSTSVHDLPMPSPETIGIGKHYRMRVVNDGQIDIIPDPLDTYTGPAHDSGGNIIVANGSNGTINGQKAILSSSSSLSTFHPSSGEKGWQDILLPAHKGYPSVFGKQNNIKLRYRIPEKVIRLDFWSKAELEREIMANTILRQEEKSHREALDLLAIVANAASMEQNKDQELKRKQSRSMTKAKNLTEIEANEMVESILPERADYPLIEPGKEPISLSRDNYTEQVDDGDDNDQNQMQSVVMTAKTESSSSKPSTLSTAPSHRLNHTIEDADTLQLRSIQQLIAYKGREALLRFLLE